MTNALKETYSFFCHNDFKTVSQRIRSREVPPLVQFFLYSVCGTLASVVFLGTVVILSKTVIPAYEHMKINGVEITDAQRAWNLLINNCIAFAITNVLAYVTNIILVFKPGRHHPVWEFLFFTLVSGISFGLSQVAGPLLVKKFGLPTNIAIFTNMVTSMLMNFAGRKFFVFKG
jgi:putative flippase GtrA